MVTPRYLLESTSWSMCPWMVYRALIGLRLLKTRITTHFSGWKAICHLFSHSYIELRSFCRICVSLLFRIGRNNRQSSANSLASDSVDSGRSLMNSKKSKGPSTVPCGTQDSTSAVVDLWPSSCTSCVRWLRKSWIHKKVLFRIP